MQLIIVDAKHVVSRAVSSWGWLRLGLSLCLLGLPVILGYWGFQLADLRHSALHKDEPIQAWVQGLRDQKADLERLSQETLFQLKALTRGMSSWHPRVLTPQVSGNPHGGSRTGSRLDIALTDTPRTPGGINWQISAVQNSGTHNSGASNGKEVASVLLAGRMGSAGASASVKTAYAKTAADIAHATMASSDAAHSVPSYGLTQPSAQSISLASPGRYRYHSLHLHKHGRPIDPASYLNATII